MGRTKKVYQDKGAGSSDIQKVSVGYDRFFSKLQKMEDEASILWYPPYNIRKTSASEYVIDIDLSGYNKEDISASMADNALIVSAPASSAFADPEGDDVYYHQGIYRGGAVSAKFFIAEGLALETANYDDGIVSFKFVASVSESKSYIVPIGPFEVKEDSAPYVPTYDSSGRIVGKKEKAEQPEKFELEDREEVSVVVNEDSHRKPTVEVVLPDPLPQVVEVSVEAIAEEVDKKSEEPQAKVKVKDASFEVVSDDVVTDVIKTPEGKADIVVAIPTEVKEAAAEAGINIVDAVEKAIEKSEAKAPELPEVKEEAPVVEVEVKPEAAEEPVVVVVPETLPAVVEAKVEDGVVVLSDTSEHVPTTAELIPVVTKDGQPDIVVAVTPSTEAHLEELGIDVVTDIGAAVIEANSDVSTSVVIPPPVIETEEAPVVLYGETDEKPTVEVILPDPLPQIVEVTVEKVEEAVDNTSEHPQVVLKVEEAVHEVSDDVVLDVVKTEEGKSDVVMAIDKADKEKLKDEVGIDPVEVVADAIAEAEIVAPELPVVEVTPVVETPVTTDSGEEVTVVAPEVIPQVVEATVEIVPSTYNSAGEPQEAETKVVLTDVSENVPADAELVPIVTAKGEHDIVMAVTEETRAALDNIGANVETVVAEALVEAKTEVVYAEPTVEPTPEPTVVSEEGTSTVTLNADNPEVPTVEVSIPEVMPQVVEAVVHVEPVVDPVSEAPQVVVDVAEATVEVSDNVELEVVKTEEGKADVVVAIDSESKAAAEEAGVNVAEVIAEAVAAAEVTAPELPEVKEEPAAVEVDITAEPVAADTIVVPEVIPQVVEVVVNDEGAIELKDTSESVNAEATVAPIVTAEGQPDAVVVVTDEVAEKLEATPEAVVAVVEAAVKEAETAVEVTPSVETPVVPETPAEPAPEAEAAPETVSVVLNTETTEVPTVEVVVPDPIPQIVEVTVEKVEDNVDSASKEPQVTLVVSDATYEVSDNVETTVVKTPEGSADVVVAVTDETAAKLEESGVDVLDSVTNAINSAVAELAVPVVEPVAVEESVEEMVVTVNDPATDQPKLEVTVDEVIPQVVEATITESVTGAPAVVLTDVSENVPTEAELIPVVTAEGESDIMVAVAPEVKAELEAANVNIMEDVSKALVEGEVEVKVVETPTETQ